MEKCEPKAIKTSKTSKDRRHIIAVRHRNSRMEGPYPENDFYGMEIGD